MKAYRTYLIVEDPKRVVLTDVPFSAGQRDEVLMVQDESSYQSRAGSSKALLWQDDKWLF
jgi:hypothetical protein